MITVSDTIKLAMHRISSGQMNLAAKLCEQVLQTNSNQPDALHILALINHSCEKSGIAVELIKKAIAINPNKPTYHYNLGIIYTNLGKTEDAIKSYQNSLYLKPDYAEAINNLGLILYDQGKIEASMVLFQQAIRNKPDFTNAYYNLGKALQAQGNPRDAIEVYDQVLKLLPDSAETRFNRSLSLLLTENFEEGWMEYEWRFRDLNDQTKKGVEKATHRWDGAAFAGKRLLVLDEQGIGDTLQFIRYLPMVKELGGTVIFETIPPLIRLFRNFRGIDELLDRSSAERAELEFDLFIPLMSLPGIFNTTLESIPDAVPYILPDTTKVQKWQRHLNKDTVNVGIVWAGKTSAEYRQNQMSGLEHVHLNWAGQPASKFASKRLARLEYFAPLTEIEGIQLYGLQKGNTADQAKTFSGSVKVANLCEESTDFSDVAAAMDNLDLIISVDTSLAHLAGAIGKPVWVLIPFVPDWRWLLKREDSPWYPTMRLFRQSEEYEWEEVFQRVAGELHALVHQ